METKGFFPLFEKEGEGKLPCRTFCKNGYESICKDNFVLRYNLSPHKKTDFNAHFHISICYILQELILSVGLVIEEKSVLGIH